MKRLIILILPLLPLLLSAQQYFRVKHGNNIYLVNAARTDSVMLPTYNTSGYMLYGFKDSMINITMGLKQNNLVSGTNIKTVNGNNVLGSGDISISSSVAWGGITGLLSNQSDLVTALALKANLISPTFVTPVLGAATATTINGGTITGNNSGDNATNTQYSGLVSNATHSGDATGATVLTLATVNSNVGSFGSATQVPNYTVNGKGLITAAANTTIQIAESQVTNLVSDLAGKQATITVLPFANGGISGSAATSATTGTMTVNMTSSIITITPTGACTFNASGGVAGQILTFSITTSGVSSFVLTFGTNFRKTGTLATGTVSARFFTVTFRCLSDNGIWTEIGRTAVQT